jgi:curved DNA-binding protein CbpA
MARDRKATIMEFVERASGALDKVDYYRLLNISSAADDETVRAAYYKYAASLHPDVHGLDVDPAYRRKLTAVFSRVSESYKVLSNPDLRARYDRELAKGHLRISMGVEVSHDAPEISDPSALRFFKLARAAVAEGDLKSAIMNLRFALQKEPDNELLKDELARVEKGKT